MRSITRSRLTAIAAACLIMGGCGKSRPAEQDAAIERIKSLGGRVGIDSQTPGLPVEGVDFSKSHVADADLAELKLFPELRWLYLDDTPITDGGLSHVLVLAHLRNLSLGGTRVTDDG